MIQLYIRGKLCDTNQDFDIKLEKSFETKEYVIESTEYSFDVDLPITETNREIFEYTDVFDTPNKFISVYDAVLNVDEVNILKGKFIMQEITNEAYSGNLYVPVKKKLKDVLGDKKMSDIKAHDMFIADWDDIKTINEGIIRGTAEDKHICFPYVLYRLPYNSTGSTLDVNTQDLSPSGNTFSVDTMFPAFNVLSVLKDCFEGEGYALKGNIFEQPKFTELYQTLNIDAKTYSDEKETPYYVSFHADYSLRKNNNTSSTALIATPFDGFSDNKIGSDAILLSENTKITNEVDDYNMLPKGINSDAHTLVVPHDGWYRIKCTGNVKYPMQSGSWGAKDRVRVCGMNNEADRVSFDNKVLEFQIRKTETPLSDVRFFANNLGTPMIPTNISEGNIEGENKALGSFNKVFFIGSYDQARNRFAKNEKTALVKDYSGFDISDFVAGARFGCTFNSPENGDSRTPSRRAWQMAYTCLPDPSKAVYEKKTDEGGVETLFFTLYWGRFFYDYAGRDHDSYRQDYAGLTAQALVRDDSYSNFEGYNSLDPMTNVWDTTSGYGSKTFPGQDNSSARVLSNSAATFTINTCVWLEEGDNLSLELVIPFNDYRDECGWIETCSWKNRGNEGILWTDCSLDFEMGIVSSKKDWMPTQENPMPTFLEMRRKKPTNVNKFLGDQKVNDFIENFLKTFNLKLTKIDNKTYSIDTQLGESRTYGNVIDLDQYANVKDAKFSRIDNPGEIKIEWNISTDEEGYKRGNTTRDPKTIRDESGYTGQLLIENDVNASGEDNNVKSNYSYTWLRDITFTGGTSVFPSGVREVPIISDSQIWDNNWQSVQGESFATNKNQRLIYLTRLGNTPWYDYFEVVRYKNDTQIPETKAPIPFCRNYYTYKSSLNQDMVFRLDYDNSLSTSNDQCITDLYYNITTADKYRVEIDVILPNHVYSQIKANTLFKLNDGLYRIEGIEGHQVNMNEKATLKLISL